MIPGEPFAKEWDCDGGDEERLNMRQVMVYAALGAKVKPAALSDDLRARMESFLVSEPAKDS